MGILDAHLSEADDLRVAAQVLLRILCELDTLWNAPVEEFDCTEARSRCPNHRLPNLTVELACADNLFRFQKDAVYSLEQLTVLVL